MTPNPPDGQGSSDPAATTPPSSDSTPTTPATPRNTSPPKKNNATTTPVNRKASGAGRGITPRTAPVPRARAGIAKRQQEPPTLLADFLMGRPSPQRIAADRQRQRERQRLASLEAVKAEMRQASVHKIQQPGGVRERVKLWQRSNAEAMAGGDPSATPTEPTDLAAFSGEEESVDEEDRVRIKMRMGRRSQEKQPAHSNNSGNSISKSEKESKDSGVAEGDGTNSQGSPSKGPPKRVVSDTNWMAKKNRKSPPRPKSPPKDKKNTTTGPHALPKDFLQRPVMNQPVSQKIQDWATKVELPESPSSSRHSRARSGDAGDGIRVKAVHAALEDLGGSSKKPPRPRPRQTDDGIRVAPLRSKRIDDDGIRVKPLRSRQADDGIRVRPSRDSQSVDDSSIVSPEVRMTGDKCDTSSRYPKSRTSLHDEATLMEESESGRINVMEESDSCVDTPTRRPSRGKPRKPSRRFTPPKPRTETVTDDRSWVSTDDSAFRTGLEDSELGSSVLTSAVGAKSLADIPFGYSAFSDLDLPSGAATDARHTRTRRNTSLKSVPNVFKKVMAEGKKILSEASEQPKPPPTNNKPPSIENWLSGTVDPFVEKTNGPESSATKEKSAEKQGAQETRARRRPSAETRRRKSSPPPRTELTEVTEVTEATESTGLTDLTETTVTTENDENRSPSPETEEPVKTPTPTGLKRRSATKATSSPLRSGGKKPFKDLLKEAFKGESGSHNFVPKRYPSLEIPQEPDYESYGDDDYSGRQDDGSKLSGSSGTWTDESSSVHHDQASPMLGPRRRPPTNGVHELSTIVGSTDDYGGQESDVTSHISDTTVTQSTALTKDTEVSQQRSHKSGSSLKRRLTKHSDLVSVLSLPDDKQLPNGLEATRSRASLRRTKSRSDSVTVDDLLQEFVDDENLYQRELKTLVDGVIPVLLTTVIHGGKNKSANLFGPDLQNPSGDGLSKAVVNMGIALEKLKNAHRKASHTDIDRLISWMQGVVPIYDSYLDAWRLGFQDLIVNLLPAADRLDDEDSLIGALPRNAEGDVVNENGERVDVAHLLKRPILRVRLLSRWAKGIHTLLSSYDTLALSGDFEALQEKARRRQKEESARLADEDAINTDTSRTRDLRTLAPLPPVKIDPSKQVNAKDLFFLNLNHSNGQRLECQVELVFRDNPSRPRDKGDLLIRETGDGKRTWLLFPPAPWPAASARKGDAKHELVIMIQGTHNGKPWYELLQLTTDNDEQVQDWLDILGTTPVPPPHRAPSVMEEPLASDPKPIDIPVGGRLRAGSASSPARGSPEPESRATTPTKRAAPRHTRDSSLPSSPAPESPSAACTPSPETTPTQKLYDEANQDTDRSRPLRESMRPEPLRLNKTSPNSKPYREDGAPPPPVHRTLSSSKPTNPPVDLKSPNVKRRTSSPLKREYLPSDDSSATEASFTEESDFESSDDEFDEDIGVPETEIGYSIKDQKQEPHPVPAPTESMVSESLCSLTPSNSASQAGLHDGGVSLPEGFTKYLASLSHWSDKRGSWKEISVDACSIVVGPGIIEAYPLVDDPMSENASKPLIALDLTPLVLLRQSTVVDLEIRSAVQSHSKYNDLGGGNFRFRCPSNTECYNLYMAVHQARLNNQKFIQLENDARFRNFGERKAPADNDGDSSSRRRSWFGRKNSYRASTRAPSQSQEGGSTAPSSSVSASSFLRRLTGGGNLSFNIARSSLDKSQPGGGSGNNSLYGSSSSSSGGLNSPRAPSMYSSARTSNGQPLSSDNIRIRLHLLVTSTKWEDYGNCVLQIRRPPPGWHQELRANHGLEKRVTVTTMPRKESEKPRILLDAVLGSGCFTPMGSRGIICGVWEELKGKNGEVGVAPATGGQAGSIKKWCFQCASVGEASWVLRLVHQEVMGTL